MIRKEIKKNLQQSAPLLPLSLQNTPPLFFQNQKKKSAITG